MMAEGREELICDLAETYGIFDMGAVPVPMLAILACGLRENARVKMKLTGKRHPEELLLLAAAVDRLSVLMWQNTEDGTKGRNKPKSILSILLEDTDEEKLQGFETADDFEKAWAEKTGVAHGR